MKRVDPERLLSEVAGRFERCFWLDGGGARAWSGRRSMVGWLERDDISLTYHRAAGEVRRHQHGRSVVIGDDIFAALQSELAAGGPEDDWVGYFGYAARADLPAAPDELLPDAIWMRPSQIRWVVHEEPALTADPALVADSGARPTESAEKPPGDYAAAFAAVQEQLHAGNSYEVNLTYRDDAVSALDPLTAYLRLRAVNPAPYAGFLQHDVPDARGWLLSSSPERYAVIGADRMLETKPIKGTTPRAAEPAEDERLRDHLASDPKIRAENLMIVDLLRNDLSMVCEPGTVEVPALMAVESYPSVHQLVSTVRGRLLPDVSTIEALHALFPAGSMTGAPKLRTMEIIDAVESSPRGAYAGAFGWIGADGRADLGVVIRALMTSGDGRYRYGTGGGVTVLSELAEEWAESRWKAARLLRALSDR
ncbi:MAG: anthranilate synthase component I family protein [Nocardioides sp.]